MTQSRRTARSVRNEAGFTLPELLVVIILTVVIVGSLGSALMINFRTLGVTNGRYVTSNDQQIAVELFFDGCGQHLADLPHVLPGGTGVR